MLEMHEIQIRFLKGNDWVWEERFTWVPNMSASCTQPSFCLIVVLPGFQTPECNVVILMLFICFLIQAVGIRFASFSIRSLQLPSALATRISVAFSSEDYDCFYKSPFHTLFLRDVCHILVQNGEEETLASELDRAQLESWLNHLLQF